MKNVTFKQLRYFEALARHGHFGHAAEASNISQPALSMQIRDLEAELGTRLFERGPRQVTLTGFGQEFAERVRDILQRVDELGELARAAQTDLSGRLRLGVIPTVAPYVLPRVIRAISARHPALDLVVRESITPRLIEELGDGRLDAAMVALPCSEAAFHEEPLFEEDFVLVRHVSDRDRPVPPPERLLEMRLLLLEEGHCFRDQALSFCAPPSTRPREILDGSSLATLVQMVGAGIGVTLIPEMALEVETRSADVAIARFPGPAPSRRIGLVWRRTSPLAGQLAGIADAVREALDSPA